MRTLKPAAFVSYMSYSGLGIVRGLGRRGIPVFALDPDRTQTGMTSRFCQARVIPRVDEHEEEHLDYLIHLALSLPEKPVLFSTGDNTVLCYARHEDSLQKHFRFAGPSAEIVRKTATKDALWRTARELGIPVPETHAPGSLDEVRAVAGTIPYPCIIKPAQPNSWHRRAVQDSLRRIPGGTEKAILARDANALVDAYQRIAAFDPNVVVSEVIPGEDRELLYFAFYRAANGRIWHFSGRKERIVPVHFGSASFVVSMEAEDLDRVSITFLEKLGYRGLGGIEFKRDARDGSLKLIEFNPRFGLWDALGQRFGIDTAAVAYLDAIGAELPEPGHARAGVRWVSICRDVRAAFGYRAEGRLSAGSWLRSLVVGEKVWAMFSWDDPLPAVVASLRFWLRAARRLTARAIGYCRAAVGRRLARDARQRAPA
jgi:predicted ATP-grasp superfamily ATP-dependent carboligase